jgi:antitoxin Phd_YefM of type II toxin-antitoxin system
VVTRNGKPAAVLVSPQDLESLEETLAILSDPSLMAQIHESEQTKHGARFSRHAAGTARRADQPSRRRDVNEQQWHVLVMGPAHARLTGSRSR